MKNKTEVNGGGFGFLILLILQIIFLVLKLTKLISWRWSIVLIPLWIYLGFIGIILLLVILWIHFDRYRGKRRHH